MSELVLDASVVCKWFLRGADEADLAAADALAERVALGVVRLHAPPHWLAEVVGVAARERAFDPAPIIGRLCELDVRIEQGPALYALAAQLARQTGAHLFDTLYHAVALSAPDRVLVTADLRYFAAARARGQIELLAEHHRRSEGGVQERGARYAAAEARIAPRLSRRPPLAARRSAGR